MPMLIRVFMLSALLLPLGGCTAIGMLADSQLGEHQNQTVDPAKPLQRESNPMILTELGMAVDATVVSGIKKVVGAKPDKPQEICRKRNNITECRQVANAEDDLLH
ncbi:hypothetical protein AGRI_01500 [Alishewanella agri BL06]|jgi:hypothetical protein|uniref:Lipoprotein n=1 Tax=Alishewanella agri BL06 TaxID=1195246 RepID=I9P6I5_9ALTE|nr:MULTISPECIES: hypothetical protein [Alishewanella]EIW90504.1 hypothetical protein AGRI_01500 [Alishewanella agri BL06]KRS22925.1 hypothetical protein AAY72_00780 [Alishewanella sp. WH16-1]